MDGRYEVFATHGKGVFSTVLRARDQQGGEGGSPSEVAIKMIRANETMSKAAQTEKVRQLIWYCMCCKSLLPINPLALFSNLSLHCFDAGPACVIVVHMTLDCF